MFAFSFKIVAFLIFNANFLLVHKQLLIHNSNNSNNYANVLSSYNYQLFQKNISKRENKCITISDKNETLMYRETASLKILK